MLRSTRSRVGLAYLTAEAVGPRGATKLTRVAHQSPMRLLPMRTALAERAGAAACALGSYGGGVLGGDVMRLRVRATAGASLALTTQSSTKVYRAKRDGRATRQALDASVADGALLVVAPDPLVPFADSVYEQAQSFAIAPGACLLYTSPSPRD